jgi:hypothetical protein
MLYNKFVIITFFISLGGNNMPIQIFSGSQGLPYLANMEMIGGVVLANNRGGFSALPVSGADTANNALAFTGSADKFLLSRSFGTAAASGSVIQALNFLKAKVDAATGIGGSGTNNQVAVFSGASTIDSSAGLTFDGSAFALAGTNTTLSGSGTMSLTPDGAFNLDSSAAITIESDSAAISIGADNIAGAINVGTGGARTVSLGSSAATEVQVDAVRVDLNAGSNGLQVDSTGATTVSGSSTGAFSYQSALTLDSSAAVSINSDSAAINIGDDTIAGAINVGTAGARTVSLGSSAATEVQVDAIRVDLNAGANGLQVDSTGATTVSGSSTGAFSYQSALTLDSSAAVSINSDSAAINIGDDNIAGAINVGTAGARTVSLGSSAATEVQVDAIRMDLNAGSNGLQVDSAGATTVSGSSTGAFSYQSGLTLDSSGAVAINSDSAAISIGGDAVGGAINVGTAGGRAISIGSVGATSLDMDAEGAVTLDSTAGSVTVGGILADGQSLGLGKTGRAQIVVSPNAASAGSENIAITNTGGTNTITAGAGAIDLHADAGGVSVRGDADSNMAVYVGAANGGVAIATKSTGDYGSQNVEGFNVIDVVSSATHAFINASGATFPVVRSAGYAVNASGTIGSLALGADAKGSAMTAFPAIGMLGVDSAGLLKQYFLQVSGGMLQVQEG